MAWADPRTGTGVFSCVVDRPPRLHRDAVRWFVSLVQVARVRPSDLVVHLVGERSEALDALQRHGVRVIEIEAFDPRVPPCNKIAGAQALAREALRPDAVVVLCDTDVAVADDPRGLPIPPGSIGCKTVDGPNPPLTLLDAAFAAAGIPRPQLVPTDCQAGGQTLEGNANGGIYVLHAALLRALVPAWAFWARWLLDSGLLVGSQFFVDQVAMALAIQAEGIAPWPLHRRWNQPVHVAQWTAGQIRPSVIHYHQSVDGAGRIAETGNPAMDSVIQTVNDATIDFIGQEGLAYLFGSGPMANQLGGLRAGVPVGAR